MARRKIKYFNIFAFSSNECDEIWIEMNREKYRNLYYFDIKAKFDAVE
jgi:hypothetical protein